VDADFAAINAEEADTTDMATVIAASMVGEMSMEGQSTAADAALQREAKLREWQEAMDQQGKRTVALLERDTARVMVGNTAIDNTVCDTGANEPLLHRRVLDRIGNVPLAAQGRKIVNVSGQATWMSRTAEPITISIATGTAREVSLSQTWLVMEGQALPDVLLNTQSMAQLGNMKVATGAWKVEYQSEPWLGEAATWHTLPLRPFDEEVAVMADAVHELVSQLPASWALPMGQHAVHADDQEEAVAGMVFTMHAVGGPSAFHTTTDSDTDSDSEAITPNSVPLVGGGGDTWPSLT
jgi:hypothetical protein